MMDYFDRYIRNQGHLDDARAYVRNNPVKAGLCATPQAWPFGSAAMEREEEGAAQGRGLAAREELRREG